MNTRLEWKWVLVTSDREYQSWVIMNVVMSEDDDELSEEIVVRENGSSESG